MRAIIRKLGLRRAASVAGALNLAYFSIEFAVALTIGSVSLFADSVDFLEDASVNLLIVLAIGWSLRQRARLGMALAGILLLPSLATVWMAWHKFLHPLEPAPASLSVTAAGAMLVNGGCAIMLARYRAHGGSLAKAAYLSARTADVDAVGKAQTNVGMAMVPYHLKAYAALNSNQQAIFRTIVPAATMHQ